MWCEHAIPSAMQSSPVQSSPVQVLQHPVVQGPCPVLLLAVEERRVWSPPPGWRCGARSVVVRVRVMASSTPRGEELRETEVLCVDCRGSLA